MTASVGKRILQRVGGIAVAMTTQAWMSSLEYRAYFHAEPSLDPGHPDFRGPAIFLFWHEYIPFPFYLRGNCNVAMLLSRHQDAEWLSQAARHMGFRTVRGSTNRGGVAAMREVLRECRTMNLAITPDGPRGPRRRLAPGAVYLASKLEIPIVPLGFGYDRPWRVRGTWDQFAIPRPFSRARTVVGAAIRVPLGIDRQGLEIARQEVESSLNAVTEEAEHWAETGNRLDGEERLRPSTGTPVSRKAA